jgi:hypothetical protein
LRSRGAWSTEAAWSIRPATCCTKRRDGSAISVSRLSGGGRIAFLDHPLTGDDRGWVSVIDLQGHRQVLTQEFSSEQGLAWSPSGDEIWFTATAVESATPGTPIGAVNLQGNFVLWPAHRFTCSFRTSLQMAGFCSARLPNRGRKASAFKPRIERERQNLDACLNSPASCTGGSAAFLPMAASCL